MLNPFYTWTIIWHEYKSGDNHDGILEDEVSNCDQPPSRMRTGGKLNHALRCLLQKSPTRLVPKWGKLKDNHTGEEGGRNEQEFGDAGRDHESLDSIGRNLMSSNWARSTVGHLWSYKGKMSMMEDVNKSQINRQNSNVIINLTRNDKVRRSMFDRLSVGDDDTD